jgi:hypothetical protein
LVNGLSPQFGQPFVDKELAEIERNEELKKLIVANAGISSQNKLGDILTLLIVQFQKSG